MLLISLFFGFYSSKRFNIETYQLKIPYFVYKMFYKAKVKNFTYIYRENNILKSKMIINYRKHRKEQIYYIKYLFPHDVLNFPAERIVEIIKNKIHDTLFPAYQKYLESKNKGFVLIDREKAKLMLADKFKGNRVYENVIYYKYPFTYGKYHGNIYRTKKGDILQIDIKKDNREYIYFFKGVDNITFDYTGKYFKEKDIVGIFKQETIFFKDKLKKYGVLFERK